MKIKKKADTYNTYTIDDVSFGEMVAIRNALKTTSSDALTDEISATIDWSLDNIPLPGEDEADFKAKKEQEETPEDEEGETSEKEPLTDIEHEAAHFPEPGSDEENDEASAAEVSHELTDEERERLDNSMDMAGENIPEPPVE